MSEGKLVTAFDMAARYLGAREVAGHGSNPEILGWLLRAGMTWATDDAEDWCSAYVYHVAWQLGLPTPASYDRLRARRWLTVGRPVSLMEARRGYDLVVLARGGGKQPGADVLDANGHIGWYSDSNSETVEALGGNQGPRGEVSFAHFPLDQALGYRRLWPL